MSVSPVRLKGLHEMTAEDEELEILTNVIGDGWPETVAQAREFDKQQKQVIELPYLFGYKPRPQTLNVQTRHNENQK